MSVCKSTYSFPCFWILLVVATLWNFATPFLLFCSFIALVQFFYGSELKFPKKFFLSPWSIFAGYYFVVSVWGIAGGTVGTKNLVELVVKCFFMPIIALKFLPSKKEDIVRSLEILRNVILGCVFFGFFESIVRYNFLVHFITNPNKVWMGVMNVNPVYQPCSFFLHYNYYGCVLLIGWLLLLYFPLKLKWLDIVCKIMLVEQIFICQSRVTWIAFLLICFLLLVKNHKITNKKICLFGIFGGIFLLVVFFFPSILNKIVWFVSERFSRFFVYGMDDGSLGQRVGTLLKFPEYFSENYIRGFFGTGYQSINVEYMKRFSYFKGYTTADCEWTVFLVETGILGLFFYIIAVFKSIWKNIFWDEKIHLFSLALFALVVESFTLDILSNNFILIFVYCFLCASYLIKTDK